MKQLKSISLTVILLLFASSLAATPYFDNGDGTVTDKNTALVWQKCSMGLNNDAACSGTATTATWTAALTYCTGLALAGKTWRLPNINELRSITDLAKSSPAIDSIAFPATVPGMYWSATTNTSITTNAWYVSFLFGQVFRITKANPYYVRCVSSGP